MWTNQDPIATVDETATTEKPDARTDSVLGCAFLEAADGPDSLTYFTPRIYSVKPKQPLSAPELRHLAVKHFVRATDALQDDPNAFPTESWVRFQIGWYSFAYEDGPRDFLLARSALERALELDPDCAPAHLALAWLLHQECQREGHAEALETTPAWDDAIGQHLRNALNPHPESPLGGDIHGGRLDDWTGNRTTLPYIVIQSGHSLMLQALDELEAIVPDSHRFAFAVAHYHVCIGRELALAYLEEAIRWPMSDDLALFEVHYQIASLMMRLGRDLTKCYKHFVRAYEHLVRLAEHNRNAVAEWQKDQSL